MNVEFRPDLTRPPGYAPRGTSLGLAGQAMLGVSVPFCMLQSLVPVLQNGLDSWLGSILPVLGFAMILTIVMATGLHKRHIWYVRWTFAVNSVLLAGYGLGVLLGLAVLLHIIPSRDPSLYFVSVVNMIYWLIQGLFVWFVVRMLRLKYWQPWTLPGSWEPGNEAPPSWSPFQRRYVPVDSDAGEARGTAPSAVPSHADADPRAPRPARPSRRR